MSRTVNGVLQLEVRRETYNGSPFRCAVLSTDDRFEFQYGTVRVRAWYDEGTALWPAAWLLANGSGPQDEFDLFEAYPNPPGSGRYGTGWLGPTRFETTLHVPDAGFRDNRTITRSDLTEGWHIWEVDWRQGQMTVLLDGQYFTTFTQDVPDAPMWLILDHVIGSHHAKADEGVRSPDSAMMRVDWIEVTRPEVTVYRDYFAYAPS